MLSGFIPPETSIKILSFKFLFSRAFTTFFTSLGFILSNITISTPLIAASKASLVLSTSISIFLVKLTYFLAFSIAVLTLPTIAI